MVIGVDIRCLERGRKTGVEEYTLNLLKTIFEADQKNKYVLFLNSWEKTKINLGWIEKYPNVEIRKFRYPNKIFNLFLWYFHRPKIDKLLGKADLFFMPNINFGSFSPKIKLIITVHDLSFEIIPETFSLKRRIWHFFINPKKLCERADKIIAVSNSTKNDILKFYKIIPDKISVIHNAISEDFRVISRNDPKFLEIKNKYRLPYYFILYLGVIEPRKNINGIIKAYNQLRLLKNTNLDKYKLIIAGAEGWKDKGIKKEIKKSPFKKDILNIGFVDFEARPYLYNLASLFIYPSFYEGFGFPPLEAMACGTPVIVSHSSSLPEITGDSGFLINPENPDEIFKAAKEILLNKNLKDKMREKGLKEANKFKWQKSAREFLEIISKLSN